MKTVVLLCAAAVMCGGCFAFIPQAKLREWEDARTGSQAQKAAVLDKDAQIRALEAENAKLKAELDTAKLKCGTACSGS